MKQNKAILLFICVFLCNNSPPLNGALTEQKQTSKETDGSIVFLPGKKLRKETLFLHDAIKIGGIAKVEEAIKWSPKQLFMLDKNENTALHIAAAEGHFDITFLLLDIYKGNKKYYEFGLKALVKKNKDQKTPQQLANEKGEEGIALTLEAAQKFFKNKLKQKQEASQKRNKEHQDQQTKTGTTIKGGFFMHFTKKSDEERDEKSSVDLLYTIKTGDLYEVQQAVKRNRECLYQIDRKRNSALHVAAESGDPDIIAYLLSEYKKNWWFHGYFFIKKPNNKGQTAADIAKKNNHKLCLALLI